MAALDQEERAADVYAGLVRRAGQLPSSKDNPAEPIGGAASRVGRDDAGRMMAPTTAQN
jgi:hypothetical protein